MNHQPNPQQEKRTSTETICHPWRKTIRRVFLGGLVLLAAGAVSATAATLATSLFESPTSSSKKTTPQSPPKTTSASPDISSAAKADALVRQAGQQLAGNKPQEALKTLQEAVAVEPKHLTARLHLAMLLAQQDRCAEAVEQYRLVLYHNPDDVVALNNFADIRASHPDENLRDGQAAKKMAERVCELTHRNSPVALGTLAAAYAENRLYSRAAQTAREAIALADRQDMPKLGELLKEQLDCYEREEPFRKRVSILYAVKKGTASEPDSLKAK